MFVTLREKETTNLNHSGTEGVHIDGGDGTEGSDGGLQQDDAFDYTVTAVNAVGESDKATMVTGVVQNGGQRQEELCNACHTQDSIHEKAEDDDTDWVHTEQAWKAKTEEMYDRGWAAIFGADPLSDDTLNGLLDYLVQNVPSD